VLLAAVVSLSACGDSGKSVDTAAYPCADFNKSLATKGDDTAGRFINDLREKAKLGEDTKTERRQIAAGIYFTCRGKPGSTKPADQAVKTAKAIKAGTFKAPVPPSKKKKSDK
jgi:hypothetical protein